MLASTASARERSTAAVRAARRRARAAARAVLRSHHVDDRPGFVWREVRATPCERSYTLRGGGEVVRIRHGKIDAFLLDEILGAGSYAIPAAARPGLAAAGHPLRIADLGANIGLSVIHFRRQFPGSRIVAFEPDPETVQVLRRVAVDNAWGDAVVIHETCAGVAAGELDFVAEGTPMSGIAEPGDARPTIRREVVDVIPLIADADLVKIDIEGAEWPILADPRLGDLGASAIALEYHQTPLVAAPEARASALLAAAGYTCETVERHQRTGIIWAWRGG